MTENLGPTAASTFIFKPCHGGELQPKADAETWGLTREGLALLCSTKRLKILAANPSKFMSMFSNTERFLYYQTTSQRMAPNNKKSSLWLGNRLFAKFEDKRKLTNSEGDSKFKTSILNPHWLWYHNDLENKHTVNRCKVVSTAELQRGQHKSILSLNLLIISLDGSKLAAILQRSILKHSCIFVFQIWPLIASVLEGGYSTIDCQ